ncbi:MAG: hypothetical protein JNM55_05990 [Anaerolineales bacterium]|nr:hypothetical protein [Anaerolineales bacterium]
MIKGFLNLPWFVWAGIALVVAVIYTFVWPKDRIADLTGFRFLVLRWTHALTWYLLAVNFLLRGLDPKFSGIANLVAASGGLIYLLFITKTFFVK